MTMTGFLVALFAVGLVIFLIGIRATLRGLHRPKIMNDEVVGLALMAAAGIALVIFAAVSAWQGPR
jgi:uncharacterized membrane protein